MLTIIARSPQLDFVPGIRDLNVKCDKSHKIWTFRVMQQYIDKATLFTFYFIINLLTPFSGTCVSACVWVGVKNGPSSKQFQQLK